MSPLGHARDVAFLINHVSASTVWATSGLTKNYLRQRTPGLFWPSGFCGQSRHPGNVAMSEYDTGSFTNFRCSVWCLLVGDRYGDRFMEGCCRLDGTYSPADQYGGSNPAAQPTAGKAKQGSTSRVGGEDCRKRQSSRRVKQRESCRASLLSSGLFWC